MNPASALSIENLEKTYANGVHALKGVSLEVAEGEFFGLLGPNGAGKTTLIGILSSLVNKSGGRAQVFGYDLDRELVRAKQQLGIVPQEFNFNIFEGVEQILIQQAGYYGIHRARAKERAEVCLKQLGLWDKRKGAAGQLSGGMKRRLMIARALMHEPRLLILDEPTAGVDIELRRSMWEYLRGLNASGVTIILTTHYLEEAESLCRRIAIIDHGEIVENTTTRELINKLNVETFIIDSERQLHEAPDLNGFPTRLGADGSLEADVARGQHLNDLFAELSSRKIGVVSMRNKSNRLEELFVKLVEKSQ